MPKEKEKEKEKRKHSGSIGVNQGNDGKRRRVYHEPEYAVPGSNLYLAPSLHGLRRVDHPDILLVYIEPTESKAKNRVKITPSITGMSRIFSSFRLCNPENTNIVFICNPYLPGSPGYRAHHRFMVANFLVALARRYHQANTLDLYAKIPVATPDQTQAIFQAFNPEYRAEYGLPNVSSPSPLSTYAESEEEKSPLSTRRSTIYSDDDEFEPASPASTNPLTPSSANEETGSSIVSLPSPSWLTQAQVQTIEPFPLRQDVFEDISIPLNLNEDATPLDPGEPNPSGYIYIQPETRNPDWDPDYSDNDIFRSNEPPVSIETNPNTESSYPPSLADSGLRSDNTSMMTEGSHFFCPVSPLPHSPMNELDLSFPSPLHFLEAEDKQDFTHLKQPPSEGQLDLYISSSPLSATTPAPLKQLTLSPSSPNPTAPQMKRFPSWPSLFSPKSPLTPSTTYLQGNDLQLIREDSEMSRSSLLYYFN